MAEHISDIFSPLNPKLLYFPVGELQIYFMVPKSNYDRMLIVKNERICTDSKTHEWVFSL